MKKVFALVIALGAMTAVFAQRGYDRRDESRDVILGQGNRNVYGNNNRGYNNGSYSKRERDEQIQRIRRQYNWKIESVQRDRYLRKAEKKRQVRFLERERDEKIREVIDRYNYYKNNKNNNRTNRRY
ncbi:MAG: hypothetical protein J7502_02735 [Flavisolibacter sp.]|nr:hypothetical protein [Flavisolibacter sp.]